MQALRWSRTFTSTSRAQYTVPTCDVRSLSASRRQNDKTFPSIRRRLSTIFKFTNFISSIVRHLRRATVQVSQALTVDTARLNIASHRRHNDVIITAVRRCPTPLAASATETVYVFRQPCREPPLFSRMRPQSEPIEGFGHNTTNASELHAELHTAGTAGPSWAYSSTAAS